MLLGIFRYLSNCQSVTMLRHRALPPQGNLLEISSKITRNQFLEVTFTFSDISLVFGRAVTFGSAKKASFPLWSTGPNSYHFRKRSVILAAFRHLCFADLSLLRHYSNKFGTVLSFGKVAVYRLLHRPFCVSAKQASLFCTQLLKGSVTMLALLPHSAQQSARKPTRNPKKSIFRSYLYSFVSCSRLFFEISLSFFSHVAKNSYLCKLK